MSRKKEYFHQLEEKIAETFLAHVHCEVLYVSPNIYILAFSLMRDDGTRQSLLKPRSQIFRQQRCQDEQR